MSTIAYVRVSTKDQTVENQLLAMNQAGYTIDRTFSDEAVSGTTKGEDRKGFSECLSYLREGDTLIVFAIDRLGRSTLDVLKNVETIKDKGVRLVILQQGLDTSTPAGKLMLTVFSGFAELENDLRRERQMLGIARAKAEGNLMGRPKTISEDTAAKARQLIAEGIPKAQIAKRLGIHRSSLYRVLEEIK
jgi:DNA invertase Pin-like site-specific DNA recombinase